MNCKKVVTALCTTLAIAGTGVVSNVQAASVHGKQFGLLSDTEFQVEPRSKRNDRSPRRPIFSLTNASTGEQWEWTPGPDNTVKPGQLRKMILTEAGLDKSALSFSVSPTPAAVVPVPAAVWLFGSGLLGLAAMARRKK